MKNFKIIPLMVLAVISSTELTYPIIFTGPARRNANRSARNQAYEAGLMEGAGAAAEGQGLDDGSLNADNSLMPEDSNLDVVTQNMYYPQAEAMIQAILVDEQDDDQNSNSAEDANTVSFAQIVEADPGLLISENYGDDASVSIPSADLNSVSVQIQSIGQQFGGGQFSGGQFGSQLSQDQKDALREVIMSRLGGGEVRTQAMESDGDENDVDIQSFEDDGDQDAVETQCVGIQCIESVEIQMADDEDENDVDIQSFEDDEDDYASIQAVEPEADHHDESAKSVEEVKPAAEQAPTAEQSVVALEKMVADHAESKSSAAPAPIVIPVPVVAPVVEDAKPMHASEPIVAKIESVIAKVESTIAKSESAPAPVAAPVNNEQVKIVKVYPVYDAVYAAINHVKSAALDMYNYLFNSKSATEVKIQSKPW